ncbi:transposase [Parvimonas sp. S3374]|uniref:Transposase n=1 Tax=Parvimonas parva TaxID=2769485 RepID=A0ABS1C8T4_9FIRM|nr:transposase [Parvimonas parva]
MRSSIYANNISETFNKQLKRKTKVNQQFTNEASLKKHVFIYASKYSSTFSTKIHKGFKIAQYELTQMLDEIQGKFEEKFSSPIGMNRPFCLP